MDRERGLPSGWRYEDGSMANYDMSFSLAPFRARAGCEMRVPLMSMLGHDGNYVVIMPNAAIGFRFADGREDAEGTYDSVGIRRVADHVRSFCQ